MLRVGLIADTHGLLRPEATAFLAGSDHIVHAGDVGLQLEVAPIRGNVDMDAWAARLREAEMIRFGAIAVYVVHDLAALDHDPRALGIRVVVSGHSHQPLVFERDGVLYVNPGSAGPRRFSLPICAAELIIDGSAVSARIQELVTG